MDYVQSKVLTFWQKVDGLLLLGVYATPLLIFIGWLIGIFTYLDGGPWWGSLFPAIFFVFAYNCIGNLAVFAEVGGSLLLDQRKRSMWLLPLLFLDLLGNVWVCSRAFFKAIFLKLRLIHVKTPFAESIRKKANTQNQYTKISNGVSNNHNHKWNKTERDGNGMHYYVRIAAELDENRQMEKAEIKMNKKERS